MKFLFYTLFVWSWSCLCMGQQAPFDSLKSKFNYYKNNVLHEKVYVHADRDYYLTGETIWLKVYVVDAGFHQPLDVSKVAYVEVLDKANLPVLQAKILLKDGLGDASIFIPASISSGNYMLRAYTNLMNNSSPDFYFHRQVTIVNPFVKPTVDKPAITQNIHAQFFPEGGHLVQQVRSKVAFKVTDGQGKGFACKGAVINQSRDTVVTFKTHRHGIGHFYFTPAENQQYKAIIYSKESTYTYSLPEIKTQGYVLHVKDSNTQWISVKVFTKMQEHTEPAVYLFGHARQQVFIAEARFIKNNEALYLIDKKNLPAGISHFTVFDSELRPVCERLYFKTAEKNLNINIQSDQQEYGVRRKVTVAVHTNAANHQPANLSIAVYKLDSLATSSNTGIHQYLWLQSDLQGAIEDPASYFSQEDAITAEARDNLMLTHGWRRFNWNDVFARKTRLEFLPEYRGHIVKGSIVNDLQQPNQGVLAFLASPNRTGKFYASRSNATGEVQFEVKELFGRRQIILQTTKPEVYRIQLKDPFSTKYSRQKPGDFNITPQIESVLLPRSIAMQVQDIYHESLASTLQPVDDTTSFYGTPDEKYYLDKYVRFQVVEEVMREYVPGVLVRKRKDGFHFKVMDDVNKSVFNEDPLVLLDGVPISVEKIMQFDPLKVKKLEVIRRRLYMGPLTAYGVASYTTYQGNLDGFQLDPGAISLNYEFLQLHREFYNPQYESPKQRESRVPDQRYLLYWRPDATTKQDGTYETSFYTSDIPGSYQIVIEGLTPDGYSGTGTNTFSVKHFNN